MNFQSENLVVDWISFNIKNLKDPKSIAKIAFYLSESFGFNSFLKDASDKKSEPLIFKNKNQFQVLFYIYNLEPNNYWVGTTVSFSGENAAYFYTAIQAKQVDWNIFNLRHTVLGRFDLHYFRKSKATDKNEPLKLFMEACCQNIYTQSKRKHAYWNQNSKGLILRIGSRQSANYCRVYEKNSGLEFELEMKKGVVKSVQHFLFSDQIEEFEDILTKHFYQQYRNSVVLDFCYTDWLLIWLRKISQDQKPFNSLVSSYLKSDNLDSFVEKERFLNLLQFLSFIRNFEGSKRFLEDQVYYVIQFPLIDFVNFIGGNNTSTYHRTKALKFLVSLQKIEPLAQKFSDSKFRSSIMFPYLKLKKQQGKALIVRIAIGEEVYFYKYPFLFPNSFLTYENGYDLQVRIELIESISKVGLRKIFHSEDFFNQFSISNQKQTQMKNVIINLLDEFKEIKLIEDEFELMTKYGILIKVNKLTPLLLTKSKYICFYETTNFNNL